MKKIFILLLIMILAFNTSCSNEEIVEKIPKSVLVREITNYDYQNYELYIGTVQSSSVVKRSFEISGKLKKLNIKKGDIVKEGMVLAKIDAEGYEIAFSAASGELNSAAGQLSKAKNAYSFAQEQYSDALTLYENGVISKNELDKAKLNLDITKGDYNSAAGVYNQAKANVDSKEINKVNTELIALNDGLVVDVLYKEGELVSAGYPVIIVRDKYPIIRFGISQNDFNLIKLGDKLKLTVNDDDIEGEITLIDQVPDLVTLTYLVEVSVKEDLTLGNFTKIKIPTTKISGAKIPINAIKSGSQDYVFVVDGKEVKKVNVEIVEILESEIVVNGLKDGDKLIIEGIKNLSAGDIVKVNNE